MSLKPFLKFLGAASVATAGFCFGIYTPEIGGEASFASTQAQNSENQSTLNDFTKLQCPSEAQFLNWAQEIHLVVPEGKSLDEACDQSQRAILAKSLLLMKSLRVNLPKSWPEPLRRDLEDTFLFLKNNSKKLALDLAQQDSVAYNKTSIQEIYLGGRFFTSGALEAISILVHEARHSVTTAPGHVNCDAGDIPRTPGACDQEFGLEDSSSGAYSYGTLFDIAMAFYAQNISEGDRQFMLTEALLQLGARFNTLPETLARKVDVLAVLSNDHKISLVHPFLGYTKELNLKFSSENEYPVRIEFATMHNGLYIYTNENRVWKWSQRTGLLVFQDEILKNLKVADIQRQRVPFRDGTLYVYRDVNGKLYYSDYSPSINARELYAYKTDFPMMRGPLPELSRMSLALFNDSAFLSRDGTLYLAPHFGDQDAFFKIASLQNPRGWKASHGGVIHDSLFLIDKDGDLYQTELILGEIVDGFDDAPFGRSYSVKKSELAEANHLLKFAQGLRIEAALKDDSSLLIWKQNSDRPHRLKINFPVQDFVLMQHAETRRHVAPTTANNKQFMSSCQISKSIRDPWLNSGMGYNRQGQAVLAGPRGECVEVDLKTLKEKTPYYDLINSQER